MISRPSPPFSPTIVWVVASVELFLALTAVLLPFPWVAVVLTPLVVWGGFGWANAQWRRHPGTELNSTAPPVKPIEALERAVAEERAAREDLTRQNAALSLDLALVHFRFTETGEFAARSLGESERFARGEVQSVLRGFRSLETTATSIESGVTESFRSMMNPDTPQSLGAIAHQSETMAVELKDFFADLGTLEKRTQTYLRSNQAELDKVNAMAARIEEFFENIRMISLNLSIEASRAGSGPAGKAFQVLAQRLRDFSTQAQQISGAQRTVVEDASRVLAGSQTELKQSFGTLAARIPPLRERLDPFNAIVQNARTQLDGALGDLSRLSAAVKGLLTNEIGQLQFQDLNRQEHEHLAQFIQWLATVEPSPVPLAADRAAQERLGFAREFNRAITTSNESRVLHDYLQSHGVPPEAVAVKGSSRSPGTVELF